MLDLLESVINSWKSYGINTVSIIFYWIAVAWFFLYRKKQNIYLYALLSAGLVTVVQCITAKSNPAVTQKAFYLLPIALVTAYAGVEIFSKTLKGKKKWIIIVLYAIIIQSGTGWRFTTEYLSNYNIEHVSLPVGQIAECIENVQQIEQPYVLAPEEVASQLQEYDVNIRVAYGEALLKNNIEVYTEDDLEQLLYEMQTYGCNMLIVKHQYDDEEYMKKIGMQQVIIFYGYGIYYKL